MADDIVNHLFERLLFIARIVSVKRGTSIANEGYWLRRFEENPQKTCLDLCTLIEDDVAAL